MKRDLIIVAAALAAAVMALQFAALLAPIL
jgi:hypothetical protein